MPGEIAVAERIAALLTARDETLAIAETAAGGRIGAALTAIPGSSRWFLGGVVAYSAAAKTALLGLTAEQLAAGAVSEAAALALARAARQRLGADWGLAETSISGPQQGRRSSKPAGLAHLAVVGPTSEHVQELQTGRDERAANQQAFADAALALLVVVLSQAEH